MTEPHEGFRVMTLKDISPKLVDLAVEVWRMRTRLNAIAQQNPKEADGIRFSLDRSEEILKEFAIEIVDHTGQSYREGMTIEVIHGTGEKIIETVRPTIKMNGRVFRPGQVVLTES